MSSVERQVGQEVPLPTRRPAALPPDDRITLPAAPPPARKLRPVVGVPSAIGLVRPRLTSMLDEVRQVRVCAVVAPAGSGKTTALAHWARRAPVDVAWWRADPDPSDPAAALLDGIGAALAASAPGRPPAIGIEPLVEALNRRDSPVVLVVDDLHHVVDRTAADLLERLLLATADHVHLVVGSRTAPPLNLARTELPSMVVGLSDLSFRSAETRELFRSTYADPLGDEDARLLTRRTGGWAAGLHLFHRTVAGRGPEVRHRAVHALSGRMRFARGYLAQAVLSELTAEQVAFLRATATFESLDGQLCDLLLGETESEERLDELARQGVLAPAEDGSGFTMHPVLRAHLVTALREELGDVMADGWFRTTAAVLAAADPLSAAPLRARVEARDWEAVLATAVGRWQAVIADADLDWVDAVPGEYATEPAVLVARAARAVRDGRLDEAARTVAGLPADAPAVVARTARRIARYCRTWQEGDLQPELDWSEHLRCALRRPSPGSGGRPSTPYDAVLRAVGLLVAGDLVSTRRELEACAARLLDNPPVECVVQALLAALDPADPGRADAVCARAEELGRPWLARLAHALAYSREDADASAAAVVDADDRGDDWGALLLVGIGAAHRLRGGQPDPGAFDDLIARCRGLDAPALEAWARCGLVLASIAAGLPDCVRDAESAIGFAHSAQVPGALAVAHGALAVARADERLRRLAEEEAERIGLGCRPWEWVDPTPQSSSAAVMERPAPLTVRCFGGFELLVAGEPTCLAGVRPRARELLRLLALYAGSPVHREVIVDAMWPALDATAATHNLHVCISGLRTALEPGVPRGASRLIPRDGDRYTLALPDGAVSDLRIFDARTASAERSRAAGEPDVAIADLEEALRLYRGEVLPEDGPTEWVLPHREHYKVRAAEAGGLLARLHLDGGRAADAAAAARRSIDIDPSRDASWRLLVTAHETAGDIAAAEEARRSYADVLVSLGVASQVATVVGSRAEGRRRTTG